MDVNDLKESLRVVEMSVNGLKDAIKGYEKYGTEKDNYWIRSMLFWIRSLNRDTALLIPNGGNEDWA